MASIGHVAVGMAAARFHAGARGGPSGSRALALSMVFWSALSLLPDAGVIGFALGIRYGAPWGHHGATHSFVFSVGLGLLLGLGAMLRQRGRPEAAASLTTGLGVAALASLVLASHALLDTLTDGGRGCALFWPFSDARHFARFRYQLVYNFTDPKLAIGQAARAAR